MLEVEQIRRQRDSGRPLDLSEFSALHWRLVLQYDAEVESHERSLRIYAKALFEALAAR